MAYRRVRYRRHCDWVGIASSLLLKQRWPLAPSPDKSQLISPAKSYIPGSHRQATALVTSNTDRTPEICGHARGTKDGGHPHDQGGEVTLRGQLLFRGLLVIGRASARCTVKSTSVAHRLRRAHLTARRFSQHPAVSTSSPALFAHGSLPPSGIVIAEHDGTPQCTGCVCGGDLDGLWSASAEAGSIRPPIS
jgi:hypothetical protein